MPEFYVVPCTGQQLGILGRNAWKYTSVNGKHIRIRPRSADVAMDSHGSVNYTAEIEVLDKEDNAWGEADSEAQAVVESLFSSLL